MGKRKISKKSTSSDGGKEPEKYEVRAVLEHKLTNGEVFFKVDWIGDETTWEPIGSLQPGAEDILHNYLLDHCDGKTGSIDALMKILQDKPRTSTGSTRGRKRNASMAGNSTCANSSNVSSSAKAESDVDSNIDDSIEDARDASSSVRSTAARKNMEKRISTTGAVKIKISGANSDLSYMTAKLSHTIGMVKKEYSKARDISYQAINFYFDGRLLNDNETIGSIGVNHNDTIEVRKPSMSLKASSQSVNNPGGSASSDQLVLAGRRSTCANPEANDMPDANRTGWRSPRVQSHLSWGQPARKENTNVQSLVAEGVDTTPDSDRNGSESASPLVDKKSAPPIQRRSKRFQAIKETPADVVHKRDNTVDVMDQSREAEAELASGDFSMNYENMAEDRVDASNESDSKVDDAGNSIIAKSNLHQELAQAGRRYSFHASEVERNPEKKVRRIKNFEKMGNRLLVARCERFDGTIDVFSYDELRSCYSQMLDNFITESTLKSL